MTRSSQRTAETDRVVTSLTDRRNTILQTIRGAERRLSLSLFRCNDKEIFAELAGAVERGVEVEVLTTARAKGGRKRLEKLWRRLERTGATVHAYTDPVVKYHAKYLVADDGPAIVASLNFTEKCFNRTCDALVVTHDPDVVAGLRLLMAADREGQRVPDTLSPRLIIGPELARKQLTALIDRARSTIRVIDAKASDPDLVTRLNERRAEGLAVEIVGAKRLGNLKSHGKIMLVDDEIAVVGSVALAALSLDFRREVAITVDDPTAVGEIEQLFKTIATASAVPAAAGDVSSVSPC
jgi:phosphatidylserine/phosphatidylglycerophosphate/cardiolipin synthase-like enzyme